MSPQFVDFDADGRLDIVAGIFDGSPHLVRGTAEGWGKPEQILDKEGARIVLNEFWNFDTHKWETTHRYDAPGRSSAGHCTSAIAMDWEGDGDLDLLLGDHRSGRVFRRTNEGTAKEPAFATINEPVFAGGEPIDVPGTVATLRLVDWDRDGLTDLACGGMGDTHGTDEGGGIYVFRNEGTKQATRFAAPITLVPASPKGRDRATRPDSGLYMDFGDHDGDGDLDIVVGGYSQWTPPRRELSPEEEQRAATLRDEIASIAAANNELLRSIQEASKGPDEAASSAKYTALYAEKKSEFAELNKRRQPLQRELDELVPAAQRVAYVWLYENVTPRVESDAAK